MTVLLVLSRKFNWLQSKVLFYVKSIMLKNISWSMYERSSWASMQKYVTFLLQEFQALAAIMGLSTHC